MAPRRARSYLSRATLIAFTIEYFSRKADVEEFFTRRWPPFPADSRPNAAARPRAARDGHAHHRSPRARVRQALPALLRRPEDHLQDHQPSDRLHGHRDRRV